MIGNEQKFVRYGVNSGRHLDVKRPGESEFGGFFGSIENFDYQEGFEYTVSIALFDLPENRNIPDNPQVRYRVLEVLSKDEKPTRPVVKIVFSSQATRCNIDGKEYDGCRLLRLETEKDFGLDLDVILNGNLMKTGEYQIEARLTTKSTVINGKSCPVYELYK